MYKNYMDDGRQQLKISYIIIYVQCLDIHVYLHFNIYVQFLRLYIYIFLQRHIIIVIILTYWLDKAKVYYIISSCSQSLCEPDSGRVGVDAGLVQRGFVLHRCVQPALPRQQHSHEAEDNMNHLFIRIIICKISI